MAEWIGSLLINSWGDLASVAGLIISFGGFWLTLAGVRKAKSAAEAARNAALQTQTSIARADMIADFSKAIAMMVELKRLHRNGEWETALERYEVLRQLFVSIRSVESGITDEDRAKILNASQQVATIEVATIERTVEAGRSPRPRQKPLNLVRLNDVMSKQIESLNEILVALKRNLGG